MERLRQLKDKTIVRYLFVGGTSFVVEMSCLLLMYHVFKLDITASTSIAYWIGLLLAFGLQKVVAFRDKRSQLHILTWQAFLFGLLTLFNWGFTVFLVGLFPAAYLIFSRPLAQVIFASWNFFLYKHVIFNEAQGNTDWWQRINRHNFAWWSVGLVAGWRVLLEGVNQLAQFVFNGKLPGLINVDRWANWDGGWYFNINNIGYHHAPGVLQQENVAFFPGFPETAGAVAKFLHIGYIPAGLLLNFLLTIALVYMLMRLAMLIAERFGASKYAKRIALLSAVALLAFPSSFFLVAYYAEAMLALGFTGAVYFALRKQFWLAVPFMIMATASKVMGAIAVLTVAVIAFEQWRREKGSLVLLAKWWGITALGLSGLLAYMTYLWMRFGDPVLFYHIQKAWGRNSEGFFATRLLKDFYFHIFDPSHFGGVYGYAINLCYMLTPIALFILVLIIWRKYKIYWPFVLTGLAMALPISTGIPDSLYRYALVAAPLIPFAILWLRNYKPFTTYALIGVSGIAMLGFAAGFLSGKYFSG